MDELLKDFLTETAEQIEAVGTQLVLLERDPSDAAMIASIFRLVHTIKGTCGFLGLTRLGSSLTPPRPSWVESATAPRPLRTQ